MSTIEATYLRARLLEIVERCEKELERASVRTATVSGIPNVLEDLQTMLTTIAFNYKESVALLQDLQSSDPPPGIGT